MLDQRALVLNRSWVPISTTTVRRAVLLMARGVAGAVHPGTFEVSGWQSWIHRGSFDGGRIRGIGFDFPVPEVIVLHGYNDVPDIPVAFTRRNVYRRDRYRCMYCGGRPRVEQLTIDHIIPRSRGGESTWDNCVTACLDCNARKADRAARDAGLRLRATPLAPNWPGGFDPEVITANPVWQRFLPSRWLSKIANA